jgi:transcriptional regulator with XRE-family HTH domain
MAKPPEQAEVENSIQFLSSLGLTMAYVERVLGLPRRTIMRWQAGEYSAAAIALLRIVCAYPWLLQVAENHFDERMSRKIIIEQAANVLYRQREQPDLTEHAEELREE